MGTKIEWATKVWNPVTGCTKGCSYCYARRFAERMKKHPNAAIAEKYRNGFKPAVHPDLVFEPRKWKNPQRVFVASMGDLFDPEFGRPPFWNMMYEMSGTPQHTFMLLTKQPEKMLRYAKQWCNFNGTQLMPHNIWCGVSVSNQEEASKLIPVLLGVPASVRFISIEPMTGPVILTESGNDYHQNYLTGTLHVSGMNEPTITPKLDWVIVGGMTGPDATPMLPKWVESIKNSCKLAGVPFFFKGWGEYISTYEAGQRSEEVDSHGRSIGDLWARQKKVYMGETLMVRVGRKLAGRKIKGIEYNEFPKI